MIMIEEVDIEQKMLSLEAEIRRLGTELREHQDKELESFISKCLKNRELSYDFSINGKTPFAQCELKCDELCQLFKEYKRVLITLQGVSFWLQESSIRISGLLSCMKSLARHYGCRFRLANHDVIAQMLSLESETQKVPYK